MLRYLYLQSRLADIFDAAIEELGIAEKEGGDDDEEHVNNLNRITVISWACRLGNEKCRNLATQRLADIASISLDLQENVLCGGLRNADYSVWEAIYNRSLTETDSTLKNNIISALGCSEVKDVLDM